MVEFNKQNGTPNAVVARALIKTLIFKSDSLTVTPLQFILLKKILAQTDGRDKAVKVVQYTAKLLLWLVVSKDREKSNPTLWKSKRLRLSNLASTFSTFRKVIRLGHAVEPFSDYYELYTEDKKGTVVWSQLPRREQVYRFLAYAGAIIGISNDIVDDIICLAKIGVLDKSLAAKYELTSSGLWFTSIIIDLYENIRTHWTLYAKHVELQNQNKKDDSANSALEKIIEKRRMHILNTIKLFADLTFCSVDLIQPEHASDGWQILSGLLSGIIGLYKHKIKLS